MTDTHSSIIERTRAQLDLGLMELADKLVSEKISDSLRSLEPPQPPVQPGRILVDDFEVKRQCHTRWCWAAVAEAVAHCYYPKTGCTQRLIAKNYIDKIEKDNKYTYGNPCFGESPTEVEQDNQLPYNVVGALVVVLYDLGCLDRMDPIVDGPADLKEVQKWIENDGKQRRIVCIRIEWPNHGGAHFVAIDGYRPGTEDLHVCDPWGPVELDISYKELSEHYTKNDGDWVTTLYTKRPERPENMCVGS